MSISATQALPLAVLAGALTFWVWCLRDVMRTDEADVRTLPKQVWLVVVALGSVVGATAWWLAGRKRT